jgi:spore germination protein YaaH
MGRFITASIVFLTLLVLSPASAFAAGRSLYFGLSGGDVTALQQQLIRLQYLPSDKATGYFGPLTKAAVQKFQCDQKIVCSGASYGVAGPKTQAALASASAIPTQSGSIGSAELTPRATGSFEFSGWVPDWRAATATQDVLPHLSQLKSVMPFGYKVDENGKLVDHANITQEPWKSFIAAAKAKGVRVVPTVLWGDGPTIQKILSNTTSRIALEDAIANMVKQNGFDGIDIDFEAKEASTINYFSTFLQGLYARMGSKWVYCTVEARTPLEDRYLPGAIIPPDATDFANNYVAMNKYCDRVELMTYDQGTIDQLLNAEKQAPYAPVADPSWVQRVTALAAQTISRNKLIIGVPTYGYEYLVTPQGGGQYQYSRLWAFNPPYATQIAEQLKINPVRTAANELGFSYNPNALAAKAPQNGNFTDTQQSTAPTTVVKNSTEQSALAPFNFITWSDAQAIADKVKLAHELGVRGIAIFSLSGAEDPAMWDVLK